MSRITFIAALFLAALWLPANISTAAAPPVNTMQLAAAKKAPVATTIQVQGVLGADVSEYDDPIDWQKLALVKPFVIMRASHGLHHDVTFAAYWAEAKKLDLLVGAYHYVDPTLPFADQLRYFVQTVKLQKGDLYPILDLEEPPLWKHMPPANRIKYILKWAQALEHIYGVKPIIYLSPSFVQDIIGIKEADALKDYPLWVAHYNIPFPWVPIPWTKFIMWQYSETGACPGIKGPCDLDVAPGTMADLQRFTMDHDAGGDASLLTAADLDDGGLTVPAPVHKHEDHQHGRTPHPKHWQPHVQHHKHAIVPSHKRGNEGKRRRR